MCVGLGRFAHSVFLRQGTVDLWWGLGNSTGLFYYGFYSPHWSYDGWGGPLYWWKLTDDDKFVGNDKFLYKQTYGKAPPDYSTCGLGVKQSPINIRASTWSKPNRHVILQISNPLVAHSIRTCWTNKYLW